MTARQFHEGQNVEVQCLECEGAPLWRKAKIVCVARITSEKIEYEVQFTDGSRAVFDAEHIRLSKEQVEQELIKNGERFLNAMGDEVAP